MQLALEVWQGCVCPYLINAPTQTAKPCATLVLLARTNRSLCSVVTEFATTVAELYGLDPTLVNPALDYSSSPWARLHATNDVMSNPAYVHCLKWAKDRQHVADRARSAGSFGVRPPSVPWRDTDLQIFEYAKQSRELVPNSVKEQPVRWEVSRRRRSCHGGGLDGQGMGATPCLNGLERRESGGLFLLAPVSSRGAADPPAVHSARGHRSQTDVPKPRRPGLPVMVRSRQEENLLDQVCHSPVSAISEHMQYMDEDPSVLTRLPDDEFVPEEDINEVILIQ